MRANPVLQTPPVTLTIIDSVTDDEIGKEATRNCLFPDLKPFERTYTVTFGLPPDYGSFTDKDQSSNDEVDFDVEPTAGSTFGETDEFTIVFRETNTPKDAGVIITPATITDNVFADANKNGIDDNEADVDDSEVKLASNPGPDGMLDHVLVDNTETEDRGVLEFAEVEPNKA